MKRIVPSYYEDEVERVSLVAVSSVVVPKILGCCGHHHENAGRDSEGAISSCALREKRRRGGWEKVRY